MVDLADHKSIRTVQATNLPIYIFHLIFFFQMNHFVIIILCVIYSNEIFFYCQFTLNKGRCSFQTKCLFSFINLKQTNKSEISSFSMGKTLNAIDSRLTETKADKNKWTL